MCREGTLHPSYALGSEVFAWSTEGSPNYQNGTFGMMDHVVRDASQDEGFPLAQPATAYDDQIHALFFRHAQYLLGRVPGFVAAPVTKSRRLTQSLYPVQV